jgi:hypothetical protein
MGRSDSPDRRTGGRTCLRRLNVWFDYNIVLFTSSLIQLSTISYLDDDNTLPLGAHIREWRNSNQSDIHEIRQCRLRTALLSYILRFPLWMEGISHQVLWNLELEQIPVCWPCIHMCVQLNIGDSWKESQVHQNKNGPRSNQTLRFPLNSYPRGYSSSWWRTIHYQDIYSRSCLNVLVSLYHIWGFQEDIVQAAWEVRLLKGRTRELCKSDPL